MVGAENHPDRMGDDQSHKTDGSRRINGKAHHQRGQNQQKGIIRVGADADFAVFNFTHSTVVDKNKNYSHAREIAVPYDGRELKCQVSYTILRGRILMKNGVVDESARAYGQLVCPARELQATGG